MATDLHTLIAMTGKPVRELARMLGFASDNSIRQMLAGNQTLPPDKLAWLEGYARLRARHAEAEADWLKKHPMPGHK
jgi:hypothetical protein